jgi:hypothetical protein
MAGPPPFLVAGDGAVCWRVDPPLTASESVMLTEPEPARPDSTAELARLLGELRQLRAEIDRNRAALLQMNEGTQTDLQQVGHGDDPQQQVEELARRAMVEEGLDLGDAYRYVAREHADAWAAARQAATLTDDLRGPTQEVTS